MCHRVNQFSHFCSWEVDHALILIHLTNYTEYKSAAFLGKQYLKYRWHWFSTFFKKMIIYCAVNITWKDKVFSFSGISQTLPLSPSWGQDGCGLGAGVSPRQLLWSTISLNLCNIQQRQRFLHLIICSCLLNIKMFSITC